MKRRRVYLSSTYEDLKDYRTAIFSGLEKAGLDVARMEAYTASDERPLDLCLRDVSSSDIYVGVYAWRYGYSPPTEHGNPHGKSITELEYRQAEGKNLRKLLFFAHPDTKVGWPRKYIDEVTGESGAGEKLDIFRKEISTEKAVNFFRTPDELAVLVLAAIMRSGLSDRPYSIPPPRAGTVVRRTRIADVVVDALIRGDSKCTTVLRGPGGFGKTTLALDACHRPEVVNAFADGMFWISLGRKPDLTQKLSDLHVAVTGVAPSVTEADAIQQALASTLRNRSCLIVVDDVWSSDVLFPLLNLDWPSFLITTRVQNLVPGDSEHGWTEILVEKMELEEAVALLGRGLPPNDQTGDALRELAERLGRWPLLLELTNARLHEEIRARSDLNQSIQYIAKLIDRRGVRGFDQLNSSERNTAVARSIDVGLEHAEKLLPGLSEKAAEIGIFPDVPVPIYVLSDLWCMNDLDVQEDVVRPLHNLSVLHWVRETNEVTLHDVIRSALDQRLSDPGAIHQRLITSWGDLCNLPHKYAWQWLTWHCSRAGDDQKLRGLLEDYRWIKAKLSETSVHALLADFRRASEELGVVRRAIERASHVLHSNPEQLPSQLWARLAIEDGSSAEKLLRTIVQIEQRPWLRPLKPSLRQLPGLKRTIASSQIESFRISYNGDRVIIFTGKSLETWNVSDGLRESSINTTGDRLYAASNDLRYALIGWSWHWLALWDLFEGRELYQIPVDGLVWVAALSGDAKAVVYYSASEEQAEQVKSLEFLATQLELPSDLFMPGSKKPKHKRNIYLWRDNAENVRCLGSVPSDLLQLIISPDNRWAVSGSIDGEIEVWNLKSAGRQIPVGRTTGSVRALTFSSSGEFLAAGGDAGPVQLMGFREAMDQRIANAARPLGMVGELKNHEASNGMRWDVQVPSVRFRNSDRELVACSRQCVGRIWDLTDFNERVFVVGQDKDQYEQVISGDGQYVLCRSDEGVQIWDIDSAGDGTLVAAHPSRVHTISGCCRTGRVASLSQDGTLQIWSPAGDVIWSTELSDFHDNVWLARHNPGILARPACYLRFSDDGTKIACAIERQSKIHVWDAQSGSPIIKFDLDIGVWSASFNDSLSLVAIVGYDGHPRVYNLESNEERPHPEPPVGRVGIASDGSLGAGLHYGHGSIWSLETGKTLRGLESYTDRPEDPGAPQCVYVNLPEKRVLATFVHGLASWNLDTGTILYLLDDLSTVWISPDMRRVVFRKGDGSLRVIDPCRSQYQSTQPLLIGDIACLKDTDRISTIAASKDAARVIVGTHDRTVFVINADSDVSIARVDLGYIPSTFWSNPEGTFIAVGDEGGNVHFLALEGL